MMSMERTSDEQGQETRDASPDDKTHDSNEGADDKATIVQPDGTPVEDSTEKR